MQENWDRIAHHLSNQYKGHGYKQSLIKSLAFCRAEMTERSETRIILGVPSDLERQLVQKTIIGDVTNEFQKLILSEFSIELEITGPQATFPAPVLDTEPAIAKVVTQLRENIETPTTIVKSSDFALSTTTVGAENSLLIRAIDRIINAPSEISFPLLITGPSGIGKSHHAKALWWELHNRLHGDKVKLITGERFLTDFLEHIRANQTWKFQRKYRKETEVLIIDDISCLKTAKKTQEEFLAVLEHFYSHKKIIVVTAHCMPGDIPGIDASVVSRLNSGLHIGLDAPGIELRRQFVETRMLGLGLSLEPAAIRLIIENSNCFRSMNGYINKIHFMFAGRRDSIAAEELSKYLKIDIGRSEFYSPEQILLHTSEKFKLDIKTIISKTRLAKVVTARNYAIYLMREKLGLTMQQIGRFVGHRDHSTIRHALHNHNKNAAAI